MKRLAVIALLCLAAGGCRQRACRHDTLLVALELDAKSRTADQLSVSVTIGSGAARTSTVDVSKLHASADLEVEFSSYPVGQSVTVVVDALEGGEVVGVGQANETLSAGCDTLTVNVSSGDVDQGVPDGGGDACTPLTACPVEACGSFTDPCGGKKLTCMTACALDSITPPFAPAGQTIYLEGRFSTSATVSFPGAPGVTATVLGPNRISVAVPTTAGMGTLTVATGEGTTRALAFRRPSFSIGAQPFEQYYPQSDYARAMPVLNTGRGGAAVLSDGAHVYVVGGESGVSDSGLQTIEQALIDADGTVGAMVTSMSSLAQGRSEAAAVRIGNYLYVIGGSSGSALADLSTSTALASIERATVATDGTLSAFSTMSNVALHTARYGHAAVIVGSTLYVVGGESGNPCNETAALLSIEQSTIGADGSLGPFTLAPESLLSPRARAGVVVNGTWLYALGGNSGFLRPRHHRVRTGETRRHARVLPEPRRDARRADARRRCALGGRSAVRARR